MLILSRELLLPFLPPEGEHPCGGKREQKRPLQAVHPIPLEERGGNKPPLGVHDMFDPPECT